MSLGACPRPILQRLPVRIPTLCARVVNLITGSSLDVIKTRLQVEARQGQTHYAGLRDAFVKICKCFFKPCWSFELTACRM